jgi:hypothetical protein
MKSQADIDLKRLQTGWSPNEIRGQYDMPAVKGGDDHYVSTNLAVAGSKKLSGEEGGNPELGGSQGEDGAAPAATPPTPPTEEGGEE